jgi:hypothetical protein
MGVFHESFSPEGVLAGASTNSIMRFRVPACMPEAILVRIQISAGYQEVQHDGARFEVWWHVRASDLILFRL